MKLIDGSVNLPHTVVVVVLLCGLFGVICLQRIPVQLKPTVDKPEIQITTTFRGASPAEVEDQITRPIEEQMDSVEGVKRIVSTSLDGRSTVTLEFDWGVNKDTALIDVVNKMNQVRDLPEDADEPAVVSISSDEQEPIMWTLMRTKTLTPNELFVSAEDIIEPRFRRVPGVSDLFVFGGEEREMQIRLNPASLVSRGISIGELIGALRRENLNVRGGFIDEGKRRYSLRTVGQFHSPEDVGSAIVRRTAEGAVYLRELAVVRPGYKKQVSQVRASGQPTVVFGAKRKSGSNMLKVCAGVAEAIEQLNGEFAAKNIDIQLVIAYRADRYIHESMALAVRNLSIGAVLASIVLIFFLKSFRSLAVVAVAIPVCMITVFIFIKLFGRSLNIISLAGLAFSSGMVVDNAIVVIENIFRHLALGETRRRAAKKATAEVWGAILISTLTTLAVFLPVIFISEEAGQLFKDIAIAICLAVGLSLLVAITVIPMLSSQLVRYTPVPAKMSLLVRVRDVVTFGWLGRLCARFYGWVIGALMGRSLVSIAAKLAIVAVVAILFRWSLAYLPDAEYLPSGNRNMILVFASPLVGNNLEKTVESIRPFETMLAADERVERFFSVFGSRFNAVGLLVKPEYADEHRMKQMVGELFGKTRALSGFESLFPNQASIFRDPGKQLEIDIIGPSLEKLNATAEMLKGQLFGTEGVKFVRSSHQAGNPEVQVRLDRQRCAALGLRVSDVADLVESLVAGKKVGVYNDDGKQIDLALHAGDGVIESRADLARIELIAPSGHPVSLESVAELVTTTGPTRIKHVEKERAITLTVNLKDEVSLASAVQNIEANVMAPAAAVLPSHYSIRLAGTADKLNSTLAALTNSFGLAVLIVYLLMVALFRSWVYPLIILITIPMAMSGAFIGVSLARQWSGGLVAFDVIAMLGLIILAGVVVNNAILIVHQALNFRDQGHTPDEALRLSCESRLRPISMSVITSLLGMLPLVVRFGLESSFPFISVGMGSGAGTELYRGLGAVLLGGLLVSTVFTLFLVPSLLSLVQDVQAAFGVGREKPSE